jgi:hypothetical protein
MTKQIDFDGKRWLQVKVAMVLQFIDYFHYPFCVELNENKRILIEYDRQAAFERFEKLLKKGVSTVYMCDEDLIIFMRDVRQALGQKDKMKIEDMTPEQVLKETHSLNTCYQFMQESFAQIGLREETVELAIEINRRSLKIIKAVPNLITLLKRMRNDLHPQFMMSLLTGCFATCILDSFSWSSDQIKEKVSLGALLARLNWEKKHFDMYSTGKIGHELTRLPTEMATQLRALNTFPKEVVEMVEQCFERPDGRGFPRGLSASNIGRLSALQMVSMDFVAELVANNFDYEQKDKIMALLRERYHDGSFKQMMDGIDRQLAA